MKTIDIAIDDLTSKTSACPVTNYCDFESPDMCGFYNSPFGLFNWTRYRGASPSFLTGPPYDHVIIILTNKQKLIILI